MLLGVGLVVTKNVRLCRGAYLECWNALGCLAPKLFSFPNLHGERARVTEAARAVTSVTPDPTVTHAALAVSQHWQ